MATKKSSSRDTDPQEIYVSRSEKKRQAKNIEEIAKELMTLSPAHIKKLPADELLKTELQNSRSLKGPALKRQIKYIASMLRENGADEVLAFLTERKGSHLKQTGEFHELERLREDIITEVIEAREEAQRNQEHLTENWQSDTIAVACRRFPALDHNALKKSALRYAATRKPVHRREMFRQLHAAMERQQFAETTPSPDEE
jgi:ribosome-associated protein